MEKAGDEKMSSDMLEELGKLRDEVKLLKARVEGLSLRRSLGLQLDYSLFQFESSPEITWSIQMQVQKRIGSQLEEILTKMDEMGFEVPAELLELQLWLRFKGNSHREKGDLSMWNDYNPFSLKEVDKI